MDQEKNLNEEITEAVEDIAQTAKEKVETEIEEVVEAAGEAVQEKAEDIIEAVEEKIRPQVYDDFSEEEAPVTAEKPAKSTNGIPFVLSTLISSVVSVVVTLVILFFINAVPAWITGAQIGGVWSLDMSEYQMGYIYVVLDDGKMTLTSDTQGVMFSCDYKVTEKETIELSGTAEEMMMVSNLISSTELKVTYDKEADALTFSPGIGGVATWNAVEPDQAKTIIEGINTPVEEPAYEDITGDVPAAETVPEAEVPEAEIPEEVPAE